MCGFIRGCCCECACAAGTVVESFFAACSLTFIAVTSYVFAGGAVALGSITANVVAATYCNVVKVLLLRLW